MCVVARITGIVLRNIAQTECAFTELRPKCNAPRDFRLISVNGTRFAKRQSEKPMQADARSAKEVCDV